MMSGVITLRNMLRRKSSQPSAPSANRIAISGGAGRDDHERHAPEEQDRDQAAGDEADGVVDQPVALDRVADLELHHRHAGELGGQPGAGEILRHRLADFADDSRCRPLPLDDGGIERQDDQRERAVLRQELAADDLVAAARARPARRRRRPSAVPPETAAPAVWPPSGGWRAENSEMMPRAPSISCRSVTRSRSFSSDSRASRFLPSTTTSTSNSLDGKRRVTSSYCLNSGVSERNNWLSESSTLSRSTPKAGADAEQDQDNGRHDRRAQRDQADPLEPIGEIMQFAGPSRRGPIGRPNLVGICCGHRLSFRRVPTVEAKLTLYDVNPVDQIRGSLTARVVVH